MTGIDRDILITRVLDGEATPEDWAAFRAMASRDPAVWGELSDAQQDRTELSMAVAEAVAVADGVDAPMDLVTGERLTVRVRAAVAWIGWAAAAMLAVGAFAGRESGSGGGMQAANLFPISSAEDALDLYKSKGQERGTFVGEMPDRLLVETRSLGEGAGYEVIYVRQLVERTRVGDVYKLSENEAGAITPVPFRPERPWSATY